MSDPAIATIDRGTGPPVLLLHGQPGDGASWRRVVDRLAPRHRVLAPDRPGYGATTLEAAGMAENAERMAELLRNREAAPAVVVGHSWSGGVAVLLAARYPDLVRALVLAGAVGTPDSVNGLDRALAAPVLGDALTVAGLAGIGIVLPRVRAGVVSGGRRLGQPGGRGRGLPGMPDASGRRSRSAPTGGSERVERAFGYLAATLPDEVLPGGWSGAWGRSRRTFVTEQRSLMEELPSVAAELGSLTLPVHVVTGAWDVVVPPSAARTLAAAIPGAGLVLVPGVGHFLARDAPDRLVEVIEGAAGGAVGGPGR